MSVKVKQKNFPPLPTRYWDTKLQRWVYPDEPPTGAELMNDVMRTMKPEATGEPRLPDLVTFEGYEDHYVMDAKAVYAYRDAMRVYMLRCVIETVNAARATELERCAEIADQEENARWSRDGASAAASIAAAIRKEIP